MAGGCLAGPKAATAASAQIASRGRAAQRSHRWRGAPRGGARLCGAALTRRPRGVAVVPSRRLVGAPRNDDPDGRPGGDAAAASGVWKLRTRRARLAVRRLRGEGAVHGARPGSGVRRAGAIPLRLAVRRGARPGAAHRVGVGTPSHAKNGIHALQHRPEAGGCRPGRRRHRATAARVVGGTARDAGRSPRQMRRRGLLTLGAVPRCPGASATRAARADMEGAARRRRRQP